jgi:hypothetical protein
MQSRLRVLLSRATGQDNKLSIGGMVRDLLQSSLHVLPVTQVPASYAFVSVCSDANNQSLFQWSFTVEVRNPAAVQNQEAVHLAVVLQSQAEVRRS